MTSQITKVTKDSLLPDSASFREMMCVPRDKTSDP